MWRWSSSSAEEVRPLPARRAFDRRSILGVLTQLYVGIVFLVLFGTRYGRLVVNFFWTGPIFVLLAGASLLAVWNIWRGWLRGYIESFGSLSLQVLAWIVVQTHGFSRQVPSIVRILMLPEALVVAALLGVDLTRRLIGGELCRRRPYRLIFRDPGEL